MRRAHSFQPLLSTDEYLERNNVNISSSSSWALVLGFPANHLWTVGEKHSITNLCFFLIQGYHPKVVVEEVVIVVVVSIIRAYVD